MRAHADLARRGSGQPPRAFNQFGCKDWTELSVAAVTPAAASATATAAAVTSAPATAASMTSAMSAAAAATTTPALALRACFVNDESAAEKFPPVESCNHLFGFSVVPNFGESETARLAREPIAKEREGIRLDARLRK
jgi:hypothetical protein